MKLSLLAIAAENHVIPEKIFDGVCSYWAEVTAEKTVIIPSVSCEKWEGIFSSACVLRVGEGSEEGTDALPMADALKKAEGKEEVFVCGDIHFVEQYWERFDCIYLSRVHCDMEGECCFPLPDRKNWYEKSRILNWTDAHCFSNIIYQREPLGLSVSVVLSTCNQSAWLEKTLWGYEAQTSRDFELIIADDGSRKDTYEMIEAIRPHLSYPVKHVWHEDKGFRKCDILNKAILASGTDYLLFSDGDCIPRNDFVAVHLKKRQKGRFLSGGYHKLPEAISKAITKEDIFSGKCFDISWLKALGMRDSFKNNKLTSFGFKAWLLNTITTTRPTWNGHNASGWLTDILAANGFDERMQYGGQDREFGERLENSGIRGKQIRYSAICVHLEHPRAYKTADSIQKNLSIRKYTRHKNIKRTPYGIVKNVQ